MIDINEIFCDDCLKTIKFNLSNNLLDEDYLKNHISNCKICQAGTKKFSLSLLKNISPMQLLTLINA